MAAACTRPARVRVLGKVYRIEYVGQIGDGGDLGECDSDAQVIRILDGQSLQSEQDTLLHELLHAVEAAQQMEIGHADIVRFTTGIAALNADNARLFHFLRRRQ